MPTKKKPPVSRSALTGLIPSVLLLVCNFPLVFFFFTYWLHNPDIHAHRADSQCIVSALKVEAFTGVGGNCQFPPPYYCVFNKN